MVFCEYKASTYAIDAKLRHMTMGTLDLKAIGNPGSVWGSCHLIKTDELDRTIQISIFY